MCEMYKTEKIHICFRIYFNMSKEPNIIAVFGTNG